MHPDLYALVIRLRPEHGSPPPNPQGQGAQALFLDLVRQADPALAEQLHADAPSKPFTVAVLPPQDAGVSEQGSGIVELRVAFTRADMFPAITRALLQRRPGAPLRLGRSAFALAEVCGMPDTHPWAGYHTFAELAACAQPARSLMLEFATATAFAQGTGTGGRARLGLLPDPASVFGSIARRWNDLAPAELRLDPRQIEDAARDTLVSRYTLETVQISLGKGPQKGFVGQCGYELPPDAAQARALALLADVVFYLGVGIKTARGMGLCRRTFKR